MRRILGTALVVVAASIMAGCGGSSKSSGAVAGVGGVGGIFLGNCLNQDDGFLVQPSEGMVIGMSPAGVNFTLTLYASAAAARAAAKNKEPKTTVVIANAVVDFKGNPAPSAGAPPATISNTEIANIRDCINRSKK